jgi:hypothetical protein
MSASVMIPVIFFILVLFFIGRKNSKNKTRMKSFIGTLEHYGFGKEQATDIYIANRKEIERMGKKGNSISMIASYYSEEYSIDHNFSEDLEHEKIIMTHSKRPTLNKNFEINFSEKAARQATIFAIVVGIIGIILYAQEIVQDQRIRGSEWIYPICYGLLAGIIGFFSGLTFFKSKNPIGLLPPFSAFFINSLISSNANGDDFGQFILVCFTLLFGLGITFLFLIIIGVLSAWVKQGK